MSEPSADILLEAHSLRKVYRDGSREVEVLKGIDLSVERREILAIIGASGVGKSTLLHILGLLDHPTSGEVSYQGRELTRLGGKEKAQLRSEHFGFVFQMFHLFPDLNAQENAMLPSLVGRGIWGRQMPKAAARKRSKELLEQMGLGNRLSHRPGQLSGGEKQRVAIARALMNSPEIVFCDEPTGNLDVETSQEIVDSLIELNRQTGQTFVLVTHEADLARKAHRVLRMHGDRMEEEAAPPGRAAAVSDVPEAHPSDYVQGGEDA